jgi:hypothetical protein
MRSFGMMLRRTRMLAPVPLPRAQAPPMAMMEVKSSKIRASPSATPVSS